MAWGVSNETGKKKKKPPPSGVFMPWAAGPTDTTSGLENFTGYEGPSVQDLIDSGQIPWDEELGLGDIGYTAPKGGAGAEDDFDTRLRNNPRNIAGKAALEENIKAAGLFRDAAIQKALWALARGQEGIARGATFRGHDASSSLAARGILQGGAMPSAQMRIEEDRGRALAEANRVAQEQQSSAEMGYSDQVRGFNQTYEELLAQISEDMAKDPRYHEPDEEEPEDKGAGSGKAPSSSGGAKAPPKISASTKAKIKAKKKNLAGRLKAGRM